MYELMVTDRFASAHNLRDYEGKCEHLHGHNYVVEAYFVKEGTEDNGIAIDFVALKKKLKIVTDELDHKYLNEDIEYFRTHNTTAENIAKYIFDFLKKEIGFVSKVCVWESEKARACYYEAGL